MTIRNKATHTKLTHNKSIKHGFNFALKPIPFIVFSIFAQHAYAEALNSARAEAQSKQQKQLSLIHIWTRSIN